MSSVDVHPDPVRFLVYGSCVSRDLVEYGLGGRRSVAYYSARQSVISAFSRPAPSEVVPPHDAPLSPFQRRMVEDDLRSALPDRMRTAAESGVQHLLWDLVDERLGVYILADGSVVTRSIDLIACGLDDALRAEARQVEFGSTEHLRIWRDAVVGMRDLTTELGITVVALDIPWAERDSRGALTPTSFGRRASEANHLLRPYHDHLRDTGWCLTAHVREDESVAAADHRWGAAPFHYADTTYAVAARRVRRLISGDLPRSPRRV